VIEFLAGFIVTCAGIAIIQESLEQTPLHPFPFALGGFTVALGICLLLRESVS
jgi:hypothetical protein